ncbi:acetyl-CoA synthetase-like protein [Hymenopellis radicata]|nr:acetyl-CoA synthetase-like protein [Hymenopellis radicata]
MASSFLCDTELLIPDNLTIAQFMLDACHPLRPKRGSTPCHVDEETGVSVSLDEVKRRTDRLAVSLEAHFGLSDDDVVLICSPNHIDYPVIAWAVHRTGGIVTSANPKSTATELHYQMKLTNPCLMVVHFSALDNAYRAASMAGLPPNRIIVLGMARSPERCTISRLIDECDSLLPSVDRTLKPGEGSTKLAFLLLSSGTTGNPKAVKIPHRAIIANTVQLALHLRVDQASPNRGFRNGDNLLGTLPFFRASCASEQPEPLNLTASDILDVAGNILLMHFAFFCGMSVIVVGQFDFLRMLKSIAHYRVCNLLLVPPQAIALCKHPSVQRYDLSSVKFVAVGAAPTSKEINGSLFNVFPEAQVGQIYGTTETPSVISMVRFDQRRGPVGSSGQILPGIETRIIKLDGSNAKCGESGELHVRGPNMSTGYLNNEVATLESFRDGWLRTGDEVVLTEDGELYVLDRIKEFIKVNGFQVAPAELEGCLLEHPDVLESCVVGVPNERSGEAPLGVIVLTASARERLQNKEVDSVGLKGSIQEHVAKRKSRYKQLIGVEFVDTIPKTASGKILRRTIRDSYRHYRSRL